MRWIVRTGAVVAVLLTAGSVLAGCGNGNDADTRGEPANRDGRSGRSALEHVDLGGARLTVGSKEFSEQLVLGEIARLALEEAGADVKSEIGTFGTVSARRALLAEDIDLYWEYTGTAWSEFLGHPRPVRDPRRQYEAVAREDLARHGITWLTPAPFDNTYALATRSDRARELDIDEISDLERLIARRPQDATLCVNGEFRSRRDGLPGLQRHYGFSFPRDSVVQLDTGVIYSAVDRGTQCRVGLVFRTDPRIGELGLTLLDDDETFFPVYNPAVTVRQQLRRELPAIAEVFRTVAPALDEETITELNRQVDIEGRLPERVARDWLLEQGFVSQRAAGR